MSKCRPFYLFLLLFVGIFIFSCKSGDSSATRTPAEEVVMGQENSSAKRSLLTPSEKQFGAIYAVGEGLYLCPGGEFIPLKDTLVLDFEEEKKAMVDKSWLEEKYFYVQFSGFLNQEEKVEVTAIESIDLLNATNSCVPFDYWCVGTEPFWAMFVSEKLNTAYFMEMDHPSVQMAYSKPTSAADGVEMYKFAKNGKILGGTLKIKKSVCSDNMSDEKYPFESEFIYGEKTLKGCAFTSE